MKIPGIIFIGVTIVNGHFLHTVQLKGFHNGFNIQGDRESYRLFQRRTEGSSSQYQPRIPALRRRISLRYTFRRHMEHLLSVS